MTALFIATRSLLGLLFVVFGLNGFLHFIPMPPATGLAADFHSVLEQSGFFNFVFAVQLLAGAMLLVNRFAPLGLAILGAVIANILAFHLLMAPAGIGMGLVALVLWVVTVYDARAHFAPLFEPITRHAADAPYKLSTQR